MADQNFGLTDTANVRMTLIASMVQDQLKEFSRLAPTVTDYSALAIPGTKEFKVPRGSALTVTGKSEDTATEGTQFTYGVDTVAYLQRYSRVNIDDYASLQSNIAIQNDLIGRMGVAFADDLDAIIYAQLKDASASAPTHKIKYTDTSNNDIEIADIVAINKLMNIQKVAKNNRTLLISPSQEAFMLKIQTFVEAHRYGGTESIREGFIGRVYGFDVVVSNVAESDNVTIGYHNSAVGYALQQGLKMEYDRDLIYLRDIIVGSYFVGATELDLGVRQVLIEPTV